jgi:hypothetical protein
MRPFMDSRKQVLWITTAGSLIVLAVAATLLIYRMRRTEEQLRQLVVRALSERFSSQVELESFHFRFFPHIEGYGEDLKLHYHGRTDIPPLIHIGRFSFSVGLVGLLRPEKHIRIVRLEKLVITIPPRERRSEERSGTTTAPSSEPGRKSVPPVIVDRIICNDADIVILPKEAGKVPLDWEIHQLTIYSVSQLKPSPFHGNLTNGKPVGEIETQGEIGPWNAEDPGGTPISGNYSFTHADLDPLPGIGGTLSSTGKYSGILEDLDVVGETDTPNFSLDKVGKPVPLHTDFSATVDGTNGDTILHFVIGRLVQTTIYSSGSVVAVPNKGHLVTIEASIPQGRIQDILALAVNSDKPFMTGPVKIKAKIVVPPGKEKALYKVILDGHFGVDDARWNSPEVREKLKSLSARGQGKPEDEDAGSAISDVKGSFHLEKGIINFLKLAFGVQGARMDVAGTYSMEDGTLDMKGHLRLEAKLSNTITGKKSFFLKVFDPFFSKDGAGTELPVTITGTREKPVFGVSILHKQVKKPVEPISSSSVEDR